MEFRSLASGLRARPTPWLLGSRQMPRIQQPILLNTLRYNSSNSSSQSPSNPTVTETAEPSTETSTSEAAEPTKSRADFDEILNKLDLGNRTQADSTKPLVQRNRSNRSNRSPRGIFSDSVSRSVGSGTGMQFRDNAVPQLASRKLELKLGPTLGRQVHVEPERGVDLAAAIRSLQVTCSTNKIKQQANQQRFHVRKGAVRKQLRRERWRKLFRFSFQETVKKIQRMQAQGW
ncbi:uncharacterized protein N7459_009229 [Penicillium hispanicum]|uniref:uncharacterized protein n=1 Tax=Penicillium hispanicum TaxID=1080232 RepID=UPI00253FC018|nr:uncharacterized protein N7459_009229 [Penicillium hispanicum]KAJ5569799.1 hypothetical protein N7459_009229 [Penicillium hispanicum]